MKPKVSIIIPVYNVEMYLCECLDSVVNQTMRDIEILCVNDGSTDESGAILEKYSIEDARIQIITQENGGLSAARNTGLDAATGEYVLFVDSDDIVDSRLCEKTYFAAQKNSADMVQFSWWGFGEGIAEKNVSLPPLVQTEKVLTQCLEKIQLEYSNCQTAWSNFYCRDFLEQHSFRFYQGLLFEDVPFVTKAAILANRVVALPERLYGYRQRTSSIMGKSRNHLQRVASFNHMFQDILPLEPPKDCLLWLYAMKCESVYKTYSKCILPSDRPAFREIIRAGLLPGEFEQIRDNELDITWQARCFFIFLCGSFGERLRGRKDYVKKWLGYHKGNCADWVAKKLISHSPWLQMLIQLAERESEEHES